MDSAPAAQDPTWTVRRRYFPAVEGMRGVAALAVLFGHVLFFGYGAGTTRGLVGTWLGVIGVNIFFAISGFLLYRPFLAARHGGKTVAAATPSYLVRRAVRIFPAYWVALTVAAAVVTLSGVFSGDWWIYYGLLQIWFPQDQLLGLPVAWTLCIEVNFYLALPFVAAALARRGAGSGHRHALAWEFGALGGLAVFSLAFSALVVSSASTVFLATTIGGLLIWFVSGMVLAALDVIHPAALAWARRLLSRPEICWPLAAAIFAPLPLGGFDGLQPQVGTILYVLSMAVVSTLLMGPVTLGDGGRTVRWTLTSRLMVFMGTISYGIYLWHLPILIWVSGKQRVIDSTYPVVTKTVLVLLGATVAGAGSWYLIEKPLMQRVRSIKAFAGRRRTAREIPPEPELEPEAAAASGPELAQGEDREGVRPGERGGGGGDAGADIDPLGQGAGRGGGAAQVAEQA